MPKRRSRPKKKANRKMVVFESLEKIVAMSEAAASTTDEDSQVAQVGGTVIEFPEIPLPPPPEKEVRSEVEKKILEEKLKELVVYFPDFLQDSVVPVLKYLDRKREKCQRRQGPMYSV